MLILSRRRDESIMIGEDIEVKILGIYGSQIRIGIRAPSEMPVHRLEVAERIKEEQQREADRANISK